MAANQNKKTKRLFIGTFVNRENFEFLYPEIKTDFNKVLSGKWVELENLHYTYKFLGAVEESIIPDIKGVLTDYLRVFKSTLEFRGIGVFPNPSDAKVLWLGLYNPDRLVFDIAQAIDEKMSTIGFRPERRRFLPHVTLNRIKKSLSSGFVDILNDYKTLKADPMTQFSVNLIESQLTPKGPIYSIVE